MKFLILSLFSILLFNSNLKAETFVDMNDDMAQITEDNDANFILALEEYPTPVQSLITGKWGYVDKAGKQVIKAVYDQANGFSSGLALVAVNKESNKNTIHYDIRPLFGFIDKKGNYAFPLIFDEAYPFNEDGTTLAWRNNDMYILTADKQMKKL